MMEQAYILSSHRPSYYLWLVRLRFGLWGVWYQGVCQGVEDRTGHWLGKNENKLLNKQASQTL